MKADQLTNNGAIVFAEPGRNDIDEAGICVPPTAYTLEGFRAWAKSDDFPEHGRFAFIGGRLYIDLTMEEIETHNKVKTEVSRVIANINVREDLGQFYSDGVLITNADAGVSNEPDAAFVLWESLRKGRVRAIPREGHQGQYVEIEGSPDWMMETVSASSVKKDTRWLPEHYHRAGIREYWLIDARGDELSFQILVYTPEGYVPAPRKNGWQYSPVFRRWFRLERLRDRMGLWKYVLRVRKDMASNERKQKRG